MPCYKVSFFKELLSSDGHPFNCLQQAIEIQRARSPEQAVEAAQRRYERLHRVSTWKLHADIIRLEIDGKEVDYQGRC